MRENNPLALLARFRVARDGDDPAAIAAAKLAFSGLAVRPVSPAELARREADEKLSAALDALPDIASPEVVVAAANSISPEEWKLLTDAPPVVVPSDRWRNEPEPPPVIWRDAEGEFRDSLVAAGEVAVMSGAGRAGKSYVAEGLAVAAARAERDGRPCEATCGLRVRAGRAVMLSFEDSPKRIDMRAQAMGGQPGDVLIVPHPPRLFGPVPETRTWGELEKWEPVWQAVREVSPCLVVVDTGPKAMGGETLDADAVIGLLQGIEREARDGGFAALVLAHDTKAARRAALAGEPVDDPVAGSGQWHDSPRCVLHLTKTGPGDADRILQCVKASYGRDGWGARLRPHYAERRYEGLKLVERLDERGVAAAREAMKPAAASKNRASRKTRAKATDAPDPDAAIPLGRDDLA